MAVPLEAPPVVSPGAHARVEAAVRTAAAPGQAVAAVLALGAQQVALGAILLEVDTAAEV